MKFIQKQILELQKQNPKSDSQPMGDVATSTTEVKKIGDLPPPPPVQEKTQGGSRILIGVVGVAIVVATIYIVHKKFFT